MDKAADIAARTFTLPSPTRHAKLAPFNDGIVALRHKGASLRLIRQLLSTVDVAVGSDTIARFLAEVISESIPPRVAKRTSARRLVSGPETMQTFALCALLYQLTSTLPTT